MKPNKFILREYDAILWSLVWQKANREGEKKEWTRTVILQQLSLDTEVSESTIRRHTEDNPPDLSNHNRIRLLAYIGYDDSASFILWVEKEKESKGKAYVLLKDIINNSPFLDSVYTSLFSESVFTEGDEDDNLLNPSQTVLLFQLIKSLNKAYSHEKQFTTIHLIADTSSIFGCLSMKDYFVQLSYVTEKEAKTRDATIRRETELNKTKLHRSIESNQLLSKDYILNFSFKNIHNLLITGNPGTGKSTFSRWLCHTWTTRPSLMGTLIPVYIQLRGVNFSSGDNPLIEYIHSTYLIDINSGQDSLHGILRKSNSIICFVLDGYDELSEENKEHLFYKLQEIASFAKYIITSRPYGIMNTYGLTWDTIIQLDGFDLANIENYIDAFLFNNFKQSKSKEQLIDIIHLNPVLSDYAHNPLMLSFMVYVYLSDEDAGNTFEKIQTRFDLQHTVINWIYRHNKVKHPPQLYSTLSQTAGEIAYEMELDKQPEIRFPVHSPTVRFVLTPLSQAGVGQIFDDGDYSCRFFFNSITFQEYFASIAIGNKITSQALEYILQDSYFWNLVAMLVGQISSDDGGFKAIETLLYGCEHRLKENEDEYEYYKFVLILSECHTRHLHDLVTNDRIQIVYKAFVRNAKNERLKYAVAECVQRVYKKINRVAQDYFKELVFQELEKSWSMPSTHLRDWNKYCSHIPSLCGYLDLPSDYLFMKKCLDLLTRTLQAIDSDKSEISAVWGLPDFILGLLNGRNEKIYIVYRNEMERILQFIPQSHVYNKANILFHYTDASNVLATFEKTVAIMNESGKNKYEEEKVEAVAIAAFIANKYSIGLSSRNSEQKNILLKSAEIISRYIISEQKEKYDYRYVSGPQPYTRLIVESLFQFGDDAELYSKALDLIAQYGDEYLYFDHIAKKHFYQYFETTINDSAGLTYENRLEKVCQMIFCIPPLKSKIAIYRNEIMKLVLTRINKHRREFDKLVPSSHAVYFFYLLEREDGAIYESDRRFFIEKILLSEFGDLAYFRKMLLPSVLSKRIVLYDSIHWEYILSYLDENDSNSIITALGIYTNPTIYQYHSNLPHIEQLLVFLLKIQQRPYYPNILQKASFSVLTIVGSTLLMLVHNHSVAQTKCTEITIMTAELLSADVLRNEVTDNIEKFEKNIAACLAYVLQYFFTSDDTFDLKIDYWNKLSTGDIREKVAEYIYPVFLQSEMLQEDRSRLKKIIGSDFFALLYTYHNKMSADHFPFARTKFEEMIG